MTRYVIILLSIAALIFYIQQEPSPPRDGRVAKGPEQNDLKDGAAFSLGEYTVKEHASYKIQARILSTNRFYLFQGADISPVDFALGWGKMSDPDVYTPLHIYQGGRFYQYHWGAEGPPIDPAEIIESSANTHLIPANESVRSKLLSFKKHEIVNLEGYLVSVTKADGYHWDSSMTRSDSGNGACELMWVENASR